MSFASLPDFRDQGIPQESLAGVALPMVLGCPDMS